MKCCKALLYNKNIIKKYKKYTLIVPFEFYTRLRFRNIIGDAFSDKSGEKNEICNHTPFDFDENRKSK